MSALRTRNVTHAAIAAGDFTGDNGDPVTAGEFRAIQSLIRLARKWPPTLKLVSMDGQLYVMHAGDSRFADDHGREIVALAMIDGIPNEGGTP